VRTVSVLDWGEKRGERRERGRKVRGEWDESGVQGTEKASKISLYTGAGGKIIISSRQCEIKKKGVFDLQVYAISEEKEKKKRAAFVKVGYACCTLIDAMIMDVR